MMNLKNRLRLSFQQPILGTIHNELRDTPKTGDDFSLGLWVSLAAAFTIGAGIFGFVGYKSGRKKKED